MNENDSRPTGQDFVDRLVMKAFGAADLPVPRVPSMYERPQALAGSWLPDLHEQLVSPEAAPTSTPNRIARSPLPMPASAEAAAAPAPPHEAAARPAAPAKGKGTLQPDPAAVKGAPSRSATDAGEHHDALTAAIVSHRSLRPSSPGNAPRTQRDGSLHGVDAGTARHHPLSTATNRPDQRKPREAAIPLRDIEPPARPVRTAVDWPAESRASEGLLVPRASGLALPAVAERDRTSRRANTGIPDTSGDLAVNVTIGRIEVRATQVVPDSKGPRLRGPQPLALDEYLGQRGAR